eukprot:TRINITY_DN4739_c0_g1_i1.p1 TRINITY_DN4739_c0_g1~~TRINITY_DN4739_c0_g1_i1.p1  ORF type:complete len:625 (+),score=130.97 TRINITY_DN4739_c0_g1_i1:83-1957(+)
MCIRDRHHPESPMPPLEQLNASIEAQAALVCELKSNGNKDDPNLEAAVVKLLRLKIELTDLYGSDHTQSLSAKSYKRALQQVLGSDEAYGGRAVAQWALYMAVWSQHSDLRMVRKSFGLPKAVWAPFVALAEAADPEKTQNQLGWVADHLCEGSTPAPPEHPGVARVWKCLQQARGYQLSIRGTQPRLASDVGEFEGDGTPWWQNARVKPGNFHVLASGERTLSNYRQFAALSADGSWLVEQSTGAYSSPHGMEIRHQDGRAAVKCVNAKGESLAPHGVQVSSTGHLFCSSPAVFFNATGSAIEVFCLESATIGMRIGNFNNNNGIYGFAGTQVPVLVVATHDAVSYQYGTNRMIGTGTTLGFVGLNGTVVAHDSPGSFLAISPTLTHTLCASKVKSGGRRAERWVLHLIDLEHPMRSTVLIDGEKMYEATGSIFAPSEIHGLYSYYQQESSASKTVSFSSDGQLVLATVKTGPSVAALVFAVSSGALVRTFPLEPVTTYGASPISRFGVSNLCVVDPAKNLWDCTGCLGWNMGSHPGMPHSLRSLVAVFIMLSTDGTVPGMGFRMLELLFSCVRELQRAPGHPWVAREAAHAMGVYQQREECQKDLGFKIEIEPAFKERCSCA